MSDLTGKFGDVQTQIATNHTAIMDALGSIASALGGAPTDTFADLVAAITVSNGLLAGMRSENNSRLDAIYNMLDIMNSNASLNAQRMLLLMLQTACACDPDLPLLPPILDVTPTSATDQEKCRRIQYFIDLFRLGWGANLASYISDYGMITSSQVDNLRGLAVSELGITTGQIAASMPTGTRDSIVSKIAYIVGSIGAPAVGAGLLAAFNDTVLIEAIRQALYAATDATSGADAFAAAVNGAALASDYQSIIVSMFYSAWPNDIYSAVPDVDDSAYDGDLCAPPAELECFDQAAIQTDNGFGLRWTIFLDPEYVGWTVNLLESSITVHIYGDGDPSRTIDTSPYVLTSANINTGPNKFWFSNQYEAYTLHVCPPE